MTNNTSRSKLLSGGPLDSRLASYLAAVGATGAAFSAADADAAIVANTSVQPFGINGAVNIDFNNDGQTDFQIDHDRVNVSGTDYDYLQIDKNDVNGHTNPLDFPTGNETFSDGVSPRNDQEQAAHVIEGPQGSYPAALELGDLIGPASTFDFQEGSNFNGQGRAIRSNRLLDEDNTTIDQVLGGRTAAQVYEPTAGPNFENLAGEVRYLGVKMELNALNQTNYGWIGIRITNEDDATGEVVGYAYETVPGVPIPAGVIPEPSGLAMALGAMSLVGARLFRRRRAK